TEGQRCLRPIIAFGTCFLILLSSSWSPQSEYRRPAKQPQFRCSVGFDPAPFCAAPMPNQKRSLSIVGPSLLLRPHHQCAPVTYVTGDLAGGALPFHPEMRSDAARHEEGRNAAAFHDKIRLGRSIASTCCSSGRRSSIRSAGCEQ